MAATVKVPPAYHDLFVLRQNERLLHLLWAVSASLLAALGIIAYLAFSRQVRTYIIETDSKGNPVGIVQPIYSTADLSQKVTETAIRQFVEDALTVTSDWSYDAVLLDKSLDRAQGDAHAWLRDFYLTPGGIHDPRKLYSKESQQARVTSVLKLPDKDWYEVWFTVYVQPNNGGQATSTDWKGTLKAELGETTSYNPLGIWIDSIDFEQVQQ